MKFNCHKRLAALSAALIAFAAAPASAVSVQTRFEGPGYYGPNNYVQMINATGPGFHNGNRTAGVIRVYDTLGNLNGGAAFDSFCIDLPQYFSNGATFETAAASMYGAAVDTDIRKLFSSAYSSISDAVTGAAFQVALWEIVTDHDNGYDLASGDLVVSGNAAVLATASGYLSALPNASDNFRVTYLRSDRYQDQVAPAPIPLPAGGLLLLSGIGGIAAMKRRSKRRSGAA